MEDMLYFSQGQYRHWYPKGESEQGSELESELGLELGLESVLELESGLEM
jgi:hypothetical protein